MDKTTSKISFLALSLSADEEAGETTDHRQHLLKYELNSSRENVRTTGYEACAVKDVVPIIRRLQPTHLWMNASNVQRVEDELLSMSDDDKKPWLFVYNDPSQALTFIRANARWYEESLLSFNVLVHCAKKEEMAFDLHRGLSPFQSALFRTMIASSKPPAMMTGDELALEQISSFGIAVLFQTKENSRQKKFIGRELLLYFTESNTGNHPETVGDVEIKRVVETLTPQ